MSTKSKASEPDRSIPPPDAPKAPEGSGAAPAPAEGRRERRKRELRQQIYEVASALFTSQGFDATTVEQIAEAADVAPATFFNHFQSKRAVLVEMTHEVMSRLQGLLDGAFAASGGTRERLIRFADAAAADIEQTRGIARDVVLILVQSESEPGEPAPFLAQVRLAIATLIREGQAAGDVRQDHEADFLAEMVVGLFNATVTGWLTEHDYPFEKRLRQAAAFAWECIQPQPAIQPIRNEATPNGPVGRTP